VETDAATLTLSGSSSNTTLVPNANIVFGGSGANRTITVTPAAGQSGTATITLTVTDANSGTASDSFVLTVTGTTTPTSTSTPTTSLNPSTYGQAVTFSSTVTGAGGTPTGTLEFFDNGTSLGVTTLSGGSASLTTSWVAAGTRSITAVYSGDSTFATSTSAARSQTVNKKATTSTVTLSSPKQYSDLEPFKLTVTGLVNGQLPAESVTFKVGTQVVGTAPMVIVGGNAEATLTAPLLEPSPFGTPPTGQMAPNPLGRTVTAVVNNVNPNYTATNATRSLVISKEDIRSTYTGQTMVSTASPTISTATVILSATLKDISATAEANGDTSPGDVRNATVTFINRDTGGSISPAIPVTLPDTSDTANGTVSYNWSVDIGTANSQTIRVGIMVGNYYTRSSSEDDTLVTVSKLITTGFTTGGGFLVMSNSSGLKPGDVGSNNDFGFGISYTGTGLNPVGNFNTLVRSTANNVRSVYQIKGTTITSLVVVGKKATIRGNVSINDITNGSVLVDGAATFEVSISDNGEPGTNDTIAVTIRNSGGAVWFSSNWVAGASVEQVIGGGNIKLP
jgi:hypothetical protein